MKKCTVLFIILFFPVLTFSQELPKTEIIVLGTVHNATVAYSEETLFSILEQLQPDIILFEHPVSWPADKFLDEAKKYKTPTLETVTLVKYLEENPPVLLQYYDIADRNKFYRETNYFEDERNLSKQLGELKEDNKLGGLAESLLEQVIILSKIRDVIGEENPRIINSAAADSAISLKHEYVNNNIIKLTEMIPELNKFNKFATISKNFWNKRNRKMAEHIIKHSKDFQGKRLVVITGYEHRCCLRNLLKKSEETNFILKEYWECIDNK